MMSTSSTCPNWLKYSLSFSSLVSHESPPTNSFPGDKSSQGDPGTLSSPGSIESLQNLVPVEKKEVENDLFMFYKNSNRKYIYFGMLVKTYSNWHILVEKYVHRKNNNFSISG